MTTLTATWNDADGLEWKVEMVRDEGESATAHATRHSEAVDALKVLHPPVVPE